VALSILSCKNAESENTNRVVAFLHSQNSYASRIPKGRENRRVKERRKKRKKEKEKARVEQSTLDTFLQV